jgi:hypothetical protein
MITEVNFILKVARYLKIPMPIVSHGIVLVVSVIITFSAIKVLAPAKNNIDSVPGIKQSINSLSSKLDTFQSVNNRRFNSIDIKTSNICNGITKTNEYIREKSRIDSLKFSKLINGKNEQFKFMDEWLNRLQNSIPYLNYTQKKTSNEIYQTL